MKPGGIIYWRELYPDVGSIDGTDHRSLIIPFDVKYELLDKVFKDLGNALGYRISDYEEYPLPAVELRILLNLLRNAQNLSDAAHQWVQQAITFIETAISKNKTLGLAI